MYYAILLFLLAVAVFFAIPNIKKEEDKPNIPSNLDSSEVQYTPPKRNPPKRTQGGSSRIKDENVANQR
jgi:hypothetical protein